MGGGWQKDGIPYLFALPHIHIEKDSRRYGRGWRKAPCVNQKILCSCSGGWVCGWLCANISIIKLRREMVVENACDYDEDGSGDRTHIDIEDARLLLTFYYYYNIWMLVNTISLCGWVDLCSTIASLTSIEGGFADVLWMFFWCFFSREKESLLFLIKKEEENDNI